jgi:hemolysin III
MQLYTKKQEAANSLTHGAGILLSLIGLPVLYVIAANSSFTFVHWIALTVYAIALLMVYFSSTLYHAWRTPKVKRILKVLDHISIYFLIAGTTSFFVIKYTEALTSTIFLSLQWGLVIAGVIFKLFLTGKFKVLSTLLYLALGLMVLFIIRSLWQNMPAEVFSWIIAGGAFYVSGTVFYLWKKLTYQHAIWHLFVLGGSISHYVALVYSF